MTDDGISRESNGISEEFFADFSEENAEDCFECGGAGWIVDDCFEDTCCCADPETEHGIIRCPNCGRENARDYREAKS